MTKVDYANKIIGLQEEYPEILCKNGKWTLEELLFNSTKELRLLYQVFLGRIWSSEHARS